MKSQVPRPNSRTRSERRAGDRTRRANVRAQSAGARRRLLTILAGLAVALIVATMIAIKVLRPAAPTSADNQPVPPSVMQDLTSVPATVTQDVGTGTTQQMPAAAHGPPLLGPNRLPEVLYVGAEYCPYCAAERWGLVVALSRFGTFSGLRTARSAADDVFPSTPTFTFYGSTYQSKYVDFVSVELQTSQRVGGSYQRLQTLTPEQNALVLRYDAPPYVPAGQAGAIPFIDVANQYVLAGASFSPGVLDNLSWQQIASGLRNPASDQTKGIVGTANLITAAVCTATSNAPSAVCTQPAIRQIEARLAKGPS